MQVCFWGTRGSLPVSLTADGVRAKILAALAAADGHSFADAAAREAFVDQLPFPIRGGFGGHSSCVELSGGDAHVICDLGSGLRPLGQRKLAQYGPGQPQTYHCFVSHLHWDHLMGLPFFTPLYIPGNRVVFHGCHAELAAAIRLQMSGPCFPVDFSQIGASVDFDLMEPGQRYEIAGFAVTAKLQLHAGDSYGYRFERDGRSVVYSTDSEHKLDQMQARAGFLDFFRAADLVIFDAMYSLAETISIKADWGHSSNIIGIELCQDAGARQLVLFHHEPIHDDDRLQGLLDDARRFEEITRGEQPPLQIISAYDGLIVDI
jgi:phosphoribosyl 1,2-cyclic phosphodiesterase